MLRCRRSVATITPSCVLMLQSVPYMTKNMSIIPVLPNQQKPQKPLYIERVAPHNYLKVKQLAQDWESLAGKKIRVHSDESDTYARLVASAVVAKFIALECYSISSNHDSSKEIYVCQDETDQVQGIAVVSKKSSALHVHYVMTHPSNIRCDANKLEGALVKGAGRSFCAFLEREAPKLGVESVVLSPLASSTDFYRKFGFTQEADGKLVKSLKAKL